MKDKPFFSIITVSYNSEKTIEQTIISILNQSFENYEYIIVDGGSTDSTLEIIKKYENEFNGKLTYISEKDNGIYDAMNKGIRNAKGKFIGIINSDDWYEKNTLQCIYDYHNDNINVDIIYGTLRIIRNEEEFGIQRIHYNFLSEKMIPHPTTFINRNVYINEGGYNTDYRYAADYDYVLKLKQKGYRFSFVNDILANYREGGATHSNIGAAIESVNVRYKYKGISKKQRCMRIIKLKLKNMIV